MDGEWISRKTILNGRQFSKGAGGGGVEGGRDGGGPNGDSLLINSSLLIFVTLPFIHMLF